MNPRRWRLRRMTKSLPIARLLGFRRRSTVLSPFVRQFTCKEIERATNGFSMIIGSGSHGTIYKARFADGLLASVKKVQSFLQGKDEAAFHRQVQLLGRLNHRHLVRLKGFSEGNKRFLIFDYMENGSLNEFLHDPLKTPLNWRTRLQIAIDVAAALEYLHFFCDPPVYEVSINSSNILLDENFVAKLSEVGVVSSDWNHVNESEATCSKGNVDGSKHVLFEFGVLLLELITGQSFRTEGAELIRWIQESSLTCSMHKMVDADLGNSYNSKELRSLVIIARLCTKTRHEPVISIPQILRYLQRKV